MRRLACLACLIGCGDQFISVSAGVNDVVAIARIDFAGHLVDAFRPTHEGSVPVELEDGESILVLTADGDSFTDSRGGPLDTAALAALVVAPDWIDPGNGCGRCLAPSRGPTLAAFPGQRCPFPADASARSFGRSFEAVDLAIEPFERERIQLHFPGECEFPRVEPSLASVESTCLLHPRDPPVAEIRVSAAADGSILLQTFDYGALVALPARASPTILPAMQPFGKADRAILPIPHLDDAAFLVIDSVDLDDSVHAGPPESFVVHVGPSGVRRETVQTNLPEATEWLRGSAERTDGRLLGSGRGGVFGRRPEIARCSETARGMIDCVRATFESCTQAGGAVGLARADDGTRFALFENGGIAREVAPDHYSCLPIRYPAELTPGLTAHDLRRVGDMIVACVRDPPSAPERKTALLELVVEDPSPRFEVIALAESETCSAIEDPGGLAIKLGASELLVSSHGIRPTSLSEHLEIAPFVIRAMHHIQGLEVVIAGGGTVFSRTASTSFVRRYGPPLAPAPEAPVLAPTRQGELVALSRGSPALIVTPPDEGAGCDARLRQLPAESLLHGRALAATEARPGRLLVVSATTAGIEAATLDLETGILTDRAQLMRAESAVLIPFDEEPALLIGPRQELVFTGPGLIAEVVDDDPSTEATEGPPNAPAWSTVAAIPASRLAWVGGEGALARVYPTPNGVRFETYWLNRVVSPDLDEIPRTKPPRIASLRAIGPDLLLMVTAVTRFDADLTGRVVTKAYVWIARVEDDRLVLARPTNGALNAQLGGVRSSMWLGPLDGLVHVSEGSWLELSKEGHPPIAEVLSSAFVGRFAVLGGTFGRLAAFTFSAP